MTFKEAIREIESHEFAVRVNLASSFRGFLRVIRAEKAVDVLLRGLEQPEKRTQLFFRAQELSRQTIDPRHENPWDIALAVYSWAIGQKDLDLAGAMARIVSEAPQCWWASNISLQLTRESLLRSEAGSEEWNFTRLESMLAVSSAASADGETILPATFLQLMPSAHLVELSQTQLGTPRPKLGEAFRHIGNGLLLASPSCTAGLSDTKEHRHKYAKPAP